MKSVFASIGGFDEAFPSAAMEDVDLRTRLVKAGHTAFFDEDAVVFHPWRREKGPSFAKSKAKSIAYFLTKHPEYRRNFSRITLGRNIVRYFIKSYIPALIRYRGKGAVVALRNRIALDCSITAALSDW
jgi:GT2 family glycosyltransferase